MISGTGCPQTCSEGKTSTKNGVAAWLEFPYKFQFFSGRPFTLFSNSGDKSGQLWLLVRFLAGSKFFRTGLFVNIGKLANSHS